MALLAEWRSDREQLPGMILELQANHAALNELLNWYRVFRFTGGDIPHARCGVAATTSYLERPFATDRISTGEVRRYGHLVQTLMEPGRAVVPPRPKTLRCRHDMANAFPALGL